VSQPPSAPAGSARPVPQPRPPARAAAGSPPPVDAADTDPVDGPDGPSGPRAPSRGEPAPPGDRPAPGGEPAPPGDRPAPGGEPAPPGDRPGTADETAPERRAAGDPLAGGSAPDRSPTAGRSDLPALAGRAAAALRAAPPRVLDLAVCLGYLVAAVVVAHGLWPHPGARVLALNPEDQIFDEWNLALGPRYWNGDTGLVTHLLNAPDGVNLLTNATNIVPALVLTPVTVLAGVPTSFAVLLVANLAGTAAGWYLLFHRGLRLRRGAAAVGAAFCGFAPGMVSQSISHVHITSQWLVPVIVWTVLRLARTAREGGRPGAVFGRGLLLGLLVVAQVFTGEEVLLLTALTLALVVTGYALRRPADAAAMAGRFAAGLAVAAGTALTLLAYPLTVQFAGPQHIPNGMFSPDYFSADLAGFVSFSPLSVAGSPEAQRLASGPSEYNTFLGWPLLALLVVLTAWQRRRTAVTVAAGAALVLCWLSLGPTIVLDGVRTGLPGPYAPLAGLPVVDGALPTRFALAAIPLVGFLLAAGLHAAAGSPGPARRLVPVAVAAALLPLVPAPLPTAARDPLPRFITDGFWRSCVRPGQVLVPAPPPTPTDPAVMAWAAAADDAFALPEGMFIGPYAAGGRASMGTWKQPTSVLLAKVAETGVVPVITGKERAQARADLEFWHAACVAVVPGPNAGAVHTTLDLLLGPGTEVADTWTWRR
jgi:hypothetical protein